MLRLLRQLQLTRRVVPTSRLNMRVTRSATRSAALAVQETQTLDSKQEERTENSVAQTAKTTKRKATATTKSTGRKKTRVAEDEERDTDASSMPAPPVADPATHHINPVIEDGGTKVLVPAELCFSFEEAKQHLIKADPRFEDVFSRLGCRPFEKLERLDPFRTLTQSILGQQISWLAARSITYKFIRLFDPSIPEKPTDYDSHGPESFFPSAQQVAAMDIPTLRTAGLSQRKAEYVLDLAARFSDGRLSTEKLLDADDEELYDMLTAVRGIGRWTVDMFAIFSLRRPDILPVGDLGVQRGLLRWILALHSPSTHDIQISPRKLPKQPDDQPDATPKAPASTQTAAATADDDVLPALPGATLADASSVPPAPIPEDAEVPKTAARGRGRANAKGRGKGKGEDAEKAAEDADEEAAGVLPTPFTPSINKVLNAVAQTMDVPPLPAGLTVSNLRTRLDTKKKIKGAFLTPDEMEQLTAPWRPYRSLGVYYMWALAEEVK